MSGFPERDLVQLPLTAAASREHGLVRHEGAALPRGESDVVIAEWCKGAIQELNPWATQAQVGEAVSGLEAILAATSSGNIVEQAKKSLTALREGVKVRDSGRKRAIQLVDLDNPTRNRWDIALEVPYRTSGGVKAVRFDIVLYCNGIPLVVVETKSILDEHASWLTAATDIAKGYTKRAPAFLAAGLFQIATDGREVRYAAINTAAQQYQRWGSTLETRPEDDTWEQVEYDFLALTNPELLCSWAQDYILHLADRSTGVLTRFVPRWTQAEAAPLMAARALDPVLKRGLLVHFQGSGKTLAMLMAANEVLRLEPKACVVILVDRLDLLSQHKQDFSQSDARRSTVEADTSDTLGKLLSKPDTSGIIITTVHRFADQGVLTTRADVTVMVDEAHRTQGTGEAQLGGQMRTALPNSTLIGLTGTPIAESERNTFDAFGCDADPGRVLHRYNAADSVRDGTTVPLVMDRRRIVQALNKEQLDTAFAAYIKAEGITSDKAELLAKDTTRWDTLLKDPRRITEISEDLAADVVTTVFPDGYGAMLVVADRAACVLYADKLKELLGSDVVTAVISGDKNDDDSFLPYIRSGADEEQVVKDFRNPTKALKVLVVTSKLLTGFDAKNCKAIYIDKPMKGHTLFQAVTRVNRTWVTPSGVAKGFGVIVDYCGVAPAVLEAFDQDVEDTSRVEIVSPTQLVAMYKSSLTRAENTLGKDFKWGAERGDLITAAKRELAGETKLLRAFRRHVNKAELIYETLPNHPAIRAERKRLMTLLDVLLSFGRSEATEREALLMAHGPAVRDLVLSHTGAPIRTDLDLVHLTPERIKELVGKPGDPKTEIQMLQSADVLEKLRERLKARLEGPHASEYSSLAAKLEQFSSTVYVETAAGVVEAATDLVAIAQQLKELDDRLGEEWDQLDLDLFGWRTRPEPVLDTRRALQQILDEYAPDPRPAGLDDVAEVLDDLVATLSYKSLREDVSAQKRLNRLLLENCKRLGILPTSKAEANEFLAQLVAYINAYLV